MRALLVTAEYPPAPCGGIGVFYRGLAAALASQGVSTHVLAVDPTIARPAHSREDGVDVHRVPAVAASARTAPVQRARRLAAAARALAAEIQPDVVETHEWAAPLWRPPAHPFVVRLHGSSTLLAAGRGKRPGRLMRFLEGRMLARADAVVAASSHVRERTAELFRLPDASIEVIPNGVDVERFCPGPQPRACEALYAGALREDKGVVELLSALAIVFRQNPAATATLAGGPDGWYELSPRIRAHIERLQAAAPGRLRLLGQVPHERIASLFQRAGVCVFPSRVEAFGLVCAEAMSCGAPVVASRLGAGAELVEHGRSGLLADPRDPQELADAILYLLADRPVAGRLGAEARRRACELYSMSQTARRTLHLYQRLLAANKPCRQRPAA